jgi:hypothetical protein
MERQLEGGIKREECRSRLCLYNETYLVTALLSRPSGLWFPVPGLKVTNRIQWRGASCKYSSVTDTYNWSCKFCDIFALYLSEPRMCSIINHMGTGRWTRPPYKAFYLRIFICGIINGTFNRKTVPVCQSTYFIEAMRRI